MATLNQVVAYLTQQRARYPMATLKAALLKQGVPEDLIDQAIVVVTEPPPSLTLEPNREDPFYFRTPSQSGIPIERPAGPEPAAAPPPQPSAPQPVLPPVPPPAPPPPPPPGPEPPPDVEAGAGDVVVRAGEAAFVLASRDSRLKAQLADFAGALVIGVMAGVLVPAAARTPGMRLAAVAGTALALAGFLGTQFYWLATRGQSIGKRWLGIRIAKADTGKNGGFITNVLLRAVAPLLILGAVGFLSEVLAGLLGLGGILLVFLDGRRCMHDMIAGTVVVKAGKDY